MIDYGASNIRSAQKAFEHIGANVVLTEDPDVVRQADKLVLPGYHIVSTVANSSPPDYRHHLELADPPRRPPPPPGLVATTLINEIQEKTRITRRVSWAYPNFGGTVWSRRPVLASKLVAANLATPACCSLL